MENNTNEKYMMYKERPLVKSGNTMYYGDMSEDYVAMLQLGTAAEFQDMQLPTRVSVQIWSTNTELLPKERIIKKTEKSTLYDALNIASIWLDRYLAQK